MAFNASTQRSVGVALSRAMNRSGFRNPPVVARRCFSDKKPPSPQQQTTTTTTNMVNNPKYAKTSAGSGRYADVSVDEFSRNRGPVSWAGLGLVAVAAATAVGYYRIERERRLEQAMGKIVSSESDGWSPDPQSLAKRQWKRTKWGWFPVEDGFPGESGVVGVGR